MTGDPYLDVPPQYPATEGLPGSSASPGVDELWPVLDWHGLWATTPADVQWLAEPLLERGRSAVLYSPPKAGKSLLALEVAAGLSAGRSVLGNAPRHRVTVLYVDLENTSDDVLERLVALGYGPGDLDRLRYLSFPSLAALDTPAGGAQLVNVVDHHAADLVIIDTVSRVISGEENAADTWAALYRYALVPLKRRGVTVLRLDHSGKDAERGQRGSSAKSADVDHVWRLSYLDGGRVTLRREASRTGHGADHVDLDRRTSPLRHVPTGQAHVDPRVQQLIAAMDAAGLAPDAGARQARDAIRGAGLSAGNELVAQVVRVRKARSDVSRTRQSPEATDEPLPGVPGDPAEDDVFPGQACPGHALDTPGHLTAEQEGRDVSVSPPRSGGHVTPARLVSGDDHTEARP